MPYPCLGEMANTWGGGGAFIDIVQGWLHGGCGAFQPLMLKNRGGGLADHPRSAAYETSCARMSLYQAVIVIVFILLH